jgi:undecaprenyl-diphosphatase
VALPLAAFVVLGAVAAGLGSLLPNSGVAHVDQPVLTSLAGDRSSGWTAFFRDVTTAGSPGFVLTYVFVVAVALLVLRRAAAAALLAVATVGADVTESLVKLVVRRARPPLPERVAHVSAHGFSFPSGHATIAAAGLGALAVVAARLCTGALRAALVALLVLGAVTVGVSRLYLGVHWPTDVISGWLLGAAAVAIGRWALRPVSGTAAAHQEETDLEFR